MIVPGKRLSRLKYRNPFIEFVELRVMLSTVPFEPLVVQDSGESIATTSAWVSDLDGDGDLDIVTGNQQQSAGSFVTWYRNQGDGSFGAAERELTEPRASPELEFRSYLMDIDGDGDEDIIRQNPTPSLVENQFSDGGTFDFTNETRLDISSIILGAADFDGDGLDDLLVQDGWARNLGLGAFEVIRLDGWRDIQQTVIFDVDRDGDSDIAAISATDRLVIHRNIGGESQFGLSEVIDWKFGNSLRIHFLPFDVDRDGDEDLFVLDPSANENNGIGKMVWFENENGLIQTGRERGFTASESLRVPMSIFLQMDVDQDGHEDLIFQNLSGGYGRYEDLMSSDWTAVDVQPGFQSATLGDLDSDGDQDWLGVGRLNLAEHRSSELRWFDGIGREYAGELVAASERIVEPYFIAPFDFDGDTLTDLLTFTEGAVSWLRNTGEGGFAESQATSTGMGLLQPHDVNGDGQMDIVDLRSFGSTQPDNGNGKLALPSSPPIALLDIDGDGDVDWVTQEAGEFYVRLNHDNSEFGDRLPLPGKPLSATDVDRDGDTDLIVSNGQEVSWYANQGDLTYGDSLLISELPKLDQKIADLDGDGDEDLLIVGAQVNLVFENRQGRFIRAEDFLADPRFPYGTIRIVDLDRDGDADIVGRGRSGLSYFENLGELRFEVAQPLPNLPVVLGTTATFVSADFDNDGLEDFAAALHSQVTLYRNQLAEKGRLATQLDIDRIFAEIRDEETHDGNDWDGDGAVTQADVDQALSTMGTTRGDVNLSGDVDFADFLLLSRSFGKQDAQWHNGDMNGDKHVGFADFLLLSAAFGT